MSGYTHCSCRDCFEIAIGEGDVVFCRPCEEAGCDVDQDCSVVDVRDDIDDVVSDMGSCMKNNYPDTTVAELRRIGVAVTRGRSAGIRYSEIFEIFKEYTGADKAEFEHMMADIDDLESDDRSSPRTRSHNAR